MNKERVHLKKMEEGKVATWRGGGGGVTGQKKKKSVKFFTVGSDPPLPNVKFFWGFNFCHA